MEIEQAKQVIEDFIKNSCILSDDVKAHQLIDALGVALEELDRLQSDKTKYRKRFKRFKRKYLELKLGIKNKVSKK